MHDFKFRFYCFLHFVIKKLLGRSTLTVGHFFHCSSFHLGVKPAEAIKYWNNFIDASVIHTDEYVNLCYAGYIAESKEWCLPSWVWTNAAIVRGCCMMNKLQEAKAIANTLADLQQNSGGWIVRNDYDKQGAIPMLAPNDSAYIANNAFLSLYQKTLDSKYLDIACRCADWIINSARPDGLVYVGYNMRDQVWDKNCVIVDVGFTAGLFANLVEITHNERYLFFLKKFINRYIDLFYIPTHNGFCTSIDKNNRQQGGMFGRGQAWALEGLIPAYKVTKDERIKTVIDATIDNLIHVQHVNGAWSYNLSRPLMGDDCKAVSVLAKDMMDWYNITHDERILKSAKKAFDWCCKHTLTEGEAAGGIFSFCMEGAIVQKLYTSCAFVYASVYAIELYEILSRDEDNYIN